ncbi:hypothetical protein K503DRAFT_773793 [Rhizopogon vinicolor AM-OR11-026]|uniref:Uncharacterized protein n=1 Tax=Rhizopogon vinicolor AM-OR11-026 TaxID=1314800 RepID=A0A1B7MRB5_9AGAM|nr:hypothetical protein K503DRAFT_773793 [Rhizopogon vinicolor AM-OR11-026]
MSETNTPMKDPLNSDAITHHAAVHHDTATSYFTTQPLRPLPTVNRHQSAVFLHFSKLLPSSFRGDAVQIDDP